MQRQNTTEHDLSRSQPQAFPQSARSPFTDHLTGVMLGCLFAQVKVSVIYWSLDMPQVHSCKSIFKKKLSYYHICPVSFSIKLFYFYHYCFIPHPILLLWYEQETIY